MSEQEKIRLKYERSMEFEIYELQRDCLHEKVSEWMGEMWAPGHFTEEKVRQCKRCGKEMERRKIRKGESVI